ncbi:PREDICTED: uncharacterized protein LOC104754548 [Camelina sativa]|uniref:Uncharacterized protein LOC104754548 n=1 Tax=Camelina sativa TaxID=90675 RepID=A0ABM0WRD0_CAMSA|nr:PREDICTED: uncharacterized protein LOC104754548 [Camelina sativa]
MVDVSEDHMYPEWSDDEENKDAALDKLINDIFHDCLPSDVWRVDTTVSMGRKKRKAKGNETGECRSSAKKLKTKADFSIDEEREKDVMKKEKKGKEHMEDVEDERKSLLDIWRMIEKMNESISDLGKNLISRMDALEGKFEAFVEKRMVVLDEKLSDRIRMVEVDLKGMKETKPTNVPVDSTSNNNEEDEANSHQPSWMVEMKETSKDEFPVPQVVKKTNTVSNKKKKSETEVSADLPLCEQTYVTQDHQKNLVGDVLKKLGRKNVRPAAVKVEKEKGKRPAVDGSELEDITDKVVALDTKMASSSEDTWDDPQQQLVSKRLDATLTRLGEHLKNLDGDTTLAKRVPQLAKSQKYPFVGNSTVKRIISSNVSYDHLKPAEDAKLQKLMDFLKLDEEAPLQTGNPDVRFYWQIMTPRLDWPSFDYGWLKDFQSPKQT